MLDRNIKPISYRAMQPVQRVIISQGESKRDWRWPRRIKSRNSAGEVVLCEKFEPADLRAGCGNNQYSSVLPLQLSRLTSTSNQYHYDEGRILISDLTPEDANGNSPKHEASGRSGDGCRQHQTTINITNINTNTTTKIFKSFILIYLLQNIASHDYQHHSPIRPTLALTSDHNQPPPSESAGEVIKRIDGLLTSNSFSSRSGETPLDFIKHIKSGDDVDGNSQRRHREARHRNRRSHHRHTHDSRGRAKRNNLAEGYLDSGADRPVVATNKGLVRGITQKIFTNKFVDAYLGIPFAQPPVGTYRFRHPQPVSPWQGEFDASRMSNSCYQVNDTFFGSNFMGTSIWNANTPLHEDCLYLNIWTPFAAANTTISSPAMGGQKLKYDGRKTHSMPAGNKIAKRAVLVWIFGGGFYSGTSTLKIYEGGALAGEEDIIVVSMNYRVSSLGFLYFARPDAPGNAGLFDQLLALQWINDNIDQFGGDPARVTIFGESAGAVSVAFHLLSPLSRNLFSQAILQSGAATCPWGSMDTKEIITNGLQLASLLNCPSNQNDLDAVIKCLLKADPMALVSQEVGQTRSVLNFPFVPVVDGSFLLEPPAESLAKANFKSARVLLGSNNNEANAFLIYLPEFSNCPANGNGNSLASDQSQSAGQAIDEPIGSVSPKVLGGGDNQDQVVNEMNDHAVVGGEIESMELLTFERQISNQRGIDNTTNQQQQQANSVQSSVRTNQKQQQQQLNAQNADTSKPCKPNEYLSLTREDFLNMLREDLNPYAGHKLGKRAIVFEYTNWNNPQDPVSYYDAIDKIVGDYYFTCHVNEFAYHYAQAGNAVYMYYFKHRSTMSPWPKWMGVLHADEINFVFGEPLNPIYNYTQKEIDLSKRIMKYWANFARYGNPTSKNGDNTSSAERWPEYKDKRQYFELNSDYIRFGHGPRAKQCAFWSQYLPQLIESYDYNNQCQVPSGGSALSPHLYPHSVQHSSEYVYPRLPRDFLPFASAPSTILFSFIFIIIIIGLVGTYFIYTKGFSWKLDLWPGSNATGGRRRWRNQRAAASRQRTNAAAAAAAAAAGFDGNTTAAPASQSQTAQTTLAATSSTTNTATTSAATSMKMLSSGLSQPQQSSIGQGARPSSMQMQSMRSPMAQVARGTNGGGSSGSTSGPTLFRQQTTICDQQTAATNGEQSAFELAQSAAARVTASGSAAAAMAAAKFKMLRSNTLAAAFGRNAENAGEAPGTGTNNIGANKNGGQPHSVAADLIALRTKDERIVNTLSSPASRSKRFEMN